MEDPRAAAEFVVSLHGAAGAGKSALGRALMDFPVANDGNLARFNVVEVDADSSPGKASLFVVRGAPTDETRASLAELRSRAARVLVVIHARDLTSDDAVVRAAWSELVDADAVHLTSTPEGKKPKGIDDLRSALISIALDAVDATVAETRRAKRPYAVAIISGAALASAVEAMLPGAAALVVTTQVGAITSLSYLYTGRWLGRAQALSLLPVFASEAAGGSIFLLVKSFFPPTGIADAAAAAVSASLTITILGAVAYSLERGYSLEQRDELREAFRRLRARSVAERAAILRNRKRWRDKSFWRDIVHRLVFEN